MDQAEGLVAERRVRRWRSVAEKRRIVELTWEPGASVALVARAHGVNANQVFKWRRAFERGEMSEPAAAAGEQSGARPLLAGNHGGSAGDHGSVALRCAPAIPPVPACIFDLLP
jgi:hypothetical protein